MFRILLAIIIVFINVVSVYAQPEFDSSSVNPLTILDLKDFNNDNAPDTVFGKRTVYSDYFPQFICWGKLPMPVDTNEEVPYQPYRDTLFIKYPQWTEIKGSYSIDDSNNDTLVDNMFFIYGKVEIGQEIKDTMTAVVLYGQYGLDSLEEVDLDITSNIQTSPCIIRKLRKGYELLYPGSRNPLRSSSMIINQLDDIVPKKKEDTDTTENSMLLSSVNVYSQNSYITYPIPARTNVRIEYEHEFQVQTISVIDATGTSVEPIHYSFTITANRVIDMNLYGLSSGAYTVMVTDKSNKIYKSTILLYR